MSTSKRVQPVYIFHECIFIWNYQPELILISLVIKKWLYWVSTAGTFWYFRQSIQHFKWSVIQTNRDKNNSYVHTMVGESGSWKYFYNESEYWYDTRMDLSCYAISDLTILWLVPDLCFVTGNQSAFMRRFDAGAINFIVSLEMYCMQEGLAIEMIICIGLLTDKHFCLLDRRNKAFFFFHLLFIFRKNDGYFCGTCDAYFTTHPNLYANRTLHIWFHLHGMEWIKNAARIYGRYILAFCFSIIYPWTGIVSRKFCSCQTKKRNLFISRFHLLSFYISVCGNGCWSGRFYRFR